MADPSASMSVGGTTAGWARTGPPVGSGPLVEASTSATLSGGVPSVDTHIRRGISSSASARSHRSMTGTAGLRRTLAACGSSPTRTGPHARLANVERSLWSPRCGGSTPSVDGGSPGQGICKDVLVPGQVAGHKKDVMLPAPCPDVQCQTAQRQGLGPAHLVDIGNHGGIVGNDIHSSALQLR